MSLTVRAIVMTEFGAPEVLVEREVDEPVVGPDQALIDVEQVNLTFVETQLRSAVRHIHPCCRPCRPFRATA
jgi:NADPH:quinone reductase-like Zn-dependent oxidoreductase